MTSKISDLYLKKCLKASGTQKLNNKSPLPVLQNIKTNLNR